MPPALRRVLPALLTVGALGCAGLGFGSGGKALNIKPPNVSIAEVRLAQMPSNKELASYYCAQYLGPLVCRVFGPVSSISDINFAFDIELEFENPNLVPLPVVQSLFAFTAFPGQSAASNLGTVCLSFCEDPDRCTQNANACTSDDPEIRDAKDFASAAKDFLFAVALGERNFRDLRVRTVAPNDRTRMVVRLGVDPTQMVDLIAKLAKGDIDRVKQGRVPQFSIPYRIEGTAWVAVESFGRLATGFGPATGEWMLRR
ncbi:MAG: hypothetical protein OES69_09540 [Myxococcales bacterium]|nr:hypothetical protein [Myxococcales bacterium]MDH3844168.1 hypothetical protein [Myxococcales bacterium]